MKTGICISFLMVAVTSVSDGFERGPGLEQLNSHFQGHSNILTRIESALPPGSQPGPLSIKYPDGRVTPVFEGFCGLGSSCRHAGFGKPYRAESEDAWTSPAQVSQVVSQRWENDAWVNDYSARYSMDPQGHATEKTDSYWVSGKWVLRSRSLNAEDGDGRQLSYEYQEWREGRWIPDTRHEFRYNAERNPAEELMIHFAGSSGLIREVYRYRNEYDSRGYLSVYRSDRYTPETPVSRSVLDDSMISELDWQPWFKQVNSVNADGQQVSLTNYSYEMGRWVPVDRTLFEYNPRGDMIVYTGEDWSDSQLTWVPAWRLLYDFDESGQYSGLRREDWSGTSWILSRAEKVRYERAEDVETSESLFYRDDMLERGTRSIVTYRDEATIGSWRFQVLENGAWIDSLLFEEFYDSKNRHLRSVHQEWRDGEWINVDQTLYSYGSTAKDAFPEWGSLSSYPNPFNARTSLRFSLMESSRVTVTVYDLRGRKIAVPAEGTFSQGPHEVVWDGIDSGGRPAPSGVFVIRLSDDRHSLTRSCVMIR
jgi:hypothetical protein